MQVQSKNKLDEFQVIGETVRIHFDYQQVTRQSINDSEETFWLCEEAVASVFDSRNTIIEKIMKTKYPTTGSEFAAINNGGEDHTNYLNFRVKAKALADKFVQTRS